LSTTLRSIKDGPNSSPQTAATTVSANLEPLTVTCDGTDAGYPIAWPSIDGPLVKTSTPKATSRNLLPVTATSTSLMPGSSTPLGRGLEHGILDDYMRLDRVRPQGPGRVVRSHELGAEDARLAG
jgi:hypothetical protein